MYALEEAGILDAEAVGANTSSFKGDAAATAATGAGGAQFSPLEISWLNSRKDTVGKDKEAESWAAARQFAKRLQTESDNMDNMDKMDKMDTD